MTADATCAPGTPRIVVDGRRIVMSEWKRLVTEVAAREPATPVTVTFSGGANLITGYRLYYILQYAKRAGLLDLTLDTDGVFWIDEAVEWLLASGVDRIVIHAGAPPELAVRVRRLDELKRASGLPRPVVEQG